MFSDLRGFTSFAETLEPATVIGALNRYLTAMSEAILDHGGTLVAYMGDGIMAVFGAPLAQDDHADRALAAARDMLERLEGFNEWLRQEGLHEGFKMGIGLNSGQVMSGHVGSERRLEYTALGDTTNTAARLEGMTKGTPLPALRGRLDAQPPQPAPRGPRRGRRVRGPRAHGDGQAVVAARVRGAGFRRAGRRRGVAELDRLVGRRGRRRGGLGGGRFGSAQSRRPPARVADHRDDRRHEHAAHDERVDEHAEGHDGAELDEHRDRQHRQRPRTSRPG